MTISPAHRPGRREQRPAGISIAAAVLELEAVGLLAAAGFSAAETIGGRSYQTASGVALTLLAAGFAVGLAVTGRALFRLRLWSRTPALLAQLSGIVVCVYLLQGHRAEWGIPLLIPALVTLVALFTPDSFKALNRLARVVTTQRSRPDQSSVVSPSRS